MYIMNPHLVAGVGAGLAERYEVLGRTYPFFFASSCLVMSRTVFFFELS